MLWKDSFMWMYVYFFLLEMVIYFVVVNFLENMKEEGLDLIMYFLSEICFKRFV